MEGRLFFISIWCGIYGQLLRFVFRDQRLSQRMWVTMVMNSLFWATGAAMLGMLLSSYFEKLDEMTFYSLLFAVAGLIIGAIVGYARSKNEQQRETLLQDNLEWADTGFSAILLASVVMFFVIQAFKIPSGSMRMTFIEGDHLFVNKFIYGIPIPFSDKKILPFKKVSPEDIVIFRFPTDDKTNQHHGKDFIKRVVATGGQKVEVINKEVFIDGVKRADPYKQHVDSIIFPGADAETKEKFQELWEHGEFQGNEIRDNFGPIVVPPGHVLVMGDNRDRSYDSRFWGPLPLKEIKGKAWLLYWPIKRFRIVK